MQDSNEFKQIQKLEEIITLLKDMNRKMSAGVTAKVPVYTQSRLQDWMVSNEPRKYPSNRDAVQSIKDGQEL